MAKAASAIIIEYRIVFFPFATRKQVGEVVIVTVFGFAVYKRSGSVKSIFGFVWGQNAA